MDSIIKEFPIPFTEYACLKRNQFKFHKKTYDACKDGLASNVSLNIGKTIVIGDISVGKTSLINRYCRNLFELDYKPTIGVEYELKKYEVLGHEFHLQMWDTSGEERFKCVTTAYYRGAHAVIVVFDMTNAVSLANTGKWLEDALEKTRSTSPLIFLVGNKLDLMTKPNVLGQVRESGITTANTLNAEYWEVSAQSGKNVNELFTRIAALCFDEAVLRELDLTTGEGGKIEVGSGRIMNTEVVNETIILGKGVTNSPIDGYYDKKTRNCCM